MHRRMFVVVLGAVLLGSCSNQTTPLEAEASTADPQVASAEPAATQDAAQRDGATPGRHPGPSVAFGDPLSGLTADELALFEEGKLAFEEAEDAADGLGPVFNEASCVACHLGPVVGGSNGRLETRFGRRNADGTFDPLASEGGSLLQDHGIGDVGGFSFGPEVVPAGANVVAQRRTTPLFGLGLVDATPDDRIRSIAEKQARSVPGMAGTLAMVPDVFTGGMAVGKFGWKNQIPTLLQFSADAYLNEMGITSPKFPDENCPQGRCEDLAHNPLPTLNDTDGADVLAFANFMTFLAPPPRGPGTDRTRAGERLFATIGCAVCHVPTLVTGPHPVKALDRVEYHPFSDFLLHDMGGLGDGIVQGAAGARQIRTAPLWGLRVAESLLHDGRASTPLEAILAHDGQARRSRSRFMALGDRDREALLAFLDSL
jgi:CxxC motif-containing protein (DUF1111 family)